MVKSLNVALSAYRLTAQFPKEELYDSPVKFAAPVPRFRQISPKAAAVTAMANWPVFRIAAGSASEFNDRYWPKIWG
ncbi:MAG: hypothetical protein M0C28_17735 [Candidatus Moduliflexus flocculans]|nr:hypothetical protein [Candidatus Moduliflexus flocculans]